MAFVQVMAIETDDIGPVQKLMAQWDAEQTGVAPGYKSNRIIRDREQGSYLIEVEFASLEEAEANNERPETAAYANRLGELITGDVTFANYDVL